MKQRKSMKNITTGPHNWYSGVQGRPDCWKRNNQEVEVNVGKLNLQAALRMRMKEKRFPEAGGVRNASPGLEVPEAPLHMCQSPGKWGNSSVPGPP